MSDTATPGYVKAADGAPIYCVYHPAANPSIPPRRSFSVVLFPSLFEERKSGYAALRRLAERLATAGHAALRFDFRGSGESGGDPAVRRWVHLAEDAVIARQTLAKLTGRSESVLLGLRMGATLALQEAARSGTEAVIALAPAVKGASQVRLWKMRSKIRSELTQAGAADNTARRAPGAPGEVFDFDGYEVNRAFFDDVAKIDLLKDLNALSSPALTLQLSHRTETTPETLELTKMLGPRATCECLRIEPFWDKVDDVDTRPMEDAVLKWLAQI